MAQIQVMFEDAGPQSSLKTAQISYKTSKKFLWKRFLKKQLAGEEVAVPGFSSHLLIP